MPMISVKGQPRGAPISVEKDSDQTISVTLDITTLLVLIAVLLALSLLMHPVPMKRHQNHLRTLNKFRDPRLYSLAAIAVSPVLNLYDNPVQVAPVLLRQG